MIVVSFGEGETDKPLVDFSVVKGSGRGGTLSIVPLSIFCYTNLVYKLVL